MGKHIVSKTLQLKTSRAARIFRQFLHGHSEKKNKWLNPLLESREMEITIDQFELVNKLDIFLA